MKKIVSRTAIAMSCVFSMAAQAEEHEKQTNIALDKVVVKGKRAKEFVDFDNKSLSTQATISKEVIENILNEAQTGSYKLLEMLPSANVHTADAYGLALNKTLRLRGAFSGDSFLRNVEGLPVSSHGGGGDFIDFENIQSVTVYRGAVPAARSFGVRNMTGGVDLSILWPMNEAGGVVKQSIGTSHFGRLFVRMDSGQLPTGTKCFISYSTTSADKWRGEGGQPGGRDNFEVGISQKLGEASKIDFFGVYHEMNGHDFRGLSYAQAQDLKNYRKFDFNSYLTGVPAQDQASYYDFNHQEYRDIMLLMSFETKFSNNSKLSVKPYYWYDKGVRLMGSPSGVRIGDPTTQPKHYGATIQYDFSMKFVDLSLGYWHQTVVDCLPPPLGMKNYRVSYLSDGSACLNYAGWASLYKVGDKVYNSPYITAQTTLGKTTLAGSLKYMHIKDPSRKSYSTAGLPDTSYASVFGYNPAADPDTTTPSYSWHFFEPSLSINHELNKKMSLYFSYGTGYEFNNWFGLMGSYTNNKALFQAAGISFRSLWDKLDIERFHNFDLGFRYKGDQFSIAPTVYYAINKNKTVSIYDPVVGASYQQSNTDATLYGAELELTARPSFAMPGDLTFYLSASYNRYLYDNDIRNASNNTVLCKDKQIADTPKFMTKLGATYTVNGFSVSPAFRYIGERYGDVENKEKVDSYVIADIQMSYHMGPIWKLKNLAFNVSALNLFDKEYIANIITSDFQTSNTVSYYPGAPFTIMAGVSAKF